MGRNDEGRVRSIQELIQHLNDAKRKQDLIPEHPGAGKGVWLSFQLWRSVLRQLQSQVVEIVNWEHLLDASHQEIGELQTTRDGLQTALKQGQNQSRAKVADLEQQLSDLHQEMTRRQQEWTKHKKELQAQADELLEEVHARSSLVKDNASLTDRLKEMARKAEAAEAVALEARQHAAELQKRLNYIEGRSTNGISERDALTQQVRELGLQLAAARDQLESHRQALAARRQPSEMLMDECKRLRDDNRRLVALIGATKEWKGLSKRMAAEEGSLHYLPMHEVLLHKGGVNGVYPALLDRAVQFLPSGDLEDWNWVPQEAIDVVMDACARVLPNAPLEPLLGMLLAVNKVWRKRETIALEALRDKHNAELRELHHLYRQRAPYETAVGRTRLSDLKRQLRLQAAHAQHLADKATADVRTASDDSKMLLALGLESVNTLSKQVKQLNGRTVKLRKRLAAKSRQPPVCASCLDSALLQVAPLSSMNDPVTIRGLIPSRPGQQQEADVDTFQFRTQPEEPEQSQAGLLRPQVDRDAALSSNPGGDAGLIRPQGVNPAQSESTPHGSWAFHADGTQLGSYPPLLPHPRPLLRSKADAQADTDTGLNGFSVPVSPGTTIPTYNLAEPHWFEAALARKAEKKSGKPGAVPVEQQKKAWAPAGTRPTSAPAKSKARPKAVESSKAVTQLVHKYAQPVLKFSLWDKDGQIKTAGQF